MKRQRITVKLPPRISSRHREPNTRNVCRGGVVLAKLQEHSAGQWFWYGTGRGINGNTSHRPDHYDAVKAEVVQLCKAWVKEQK